MPSRYSHSALDCFRGCPRKFKFRYIEKAEILKRTPAHIYLGAALHRVLQMLHVWGADGKLCSLDDALRQYEAEWQKPDKKDIVVTNEHMAVDDYVESGRQMLKRYYEKYKPFDQGRLLGAELNLNFDLPGTGFRFRAKIDKLWKRDDGVIEVCDYKTGGRFPQGSRDPSFRLQMGLYQLAVQSTYPQFDVIELAQYFLKHDEVLSCQLSPDEIDELTEQFRVEVVATINSERLDDFPTKEGPFCDYCDYFKLCPAKRHRLILESEAGTGGEEKATMETAAVLADKFIELDGEKKRIAAEHAALKEDILRTAKELSLDRLSGASADISVKIAAEEKFPTKSADPDRFAKLSYLVRQWALDECFALDCNLLMKEIYRKGRLSKDQLSQLKEFVFETERGLVKVVKKKDVGDNS